MNYPIEIHVRDIYSLFIIRDLFRSVAVRTRDINKSNNNCSCAVITEFDSTAATRKKLVHSRSNSG